MTPEELRARVILRDSNVIVLDKPAGLAVHGGPKTFVHLEGMLDALCFGLGHAPRLVHRLDRDTSGCLALARHHKAVVRLGRLFSAGKVDKVYWAVVSGVPAGEGGVIRLPLAKENARSGWRMVADPAGQPAVTEWRLMGQGQGCSWLELHPRSGRTHQIRVHCATGLGCPILGDPVYGGAAALRADLAQDSLPAVPMHLHSRSLAIPYWADRPPVSAVAPPPPHMEAALRACGWPPG